MQLNKLTSSSYGKLRRLAPLHRTQQHIPHVRALNAPNNAKAESKQTEEREPIHQLRLLDEVANVVPVDLDLGLSFEGDEYMKGMLTVQAVLSQPGLALLWHKAESRAIPCVGQCLKALTFSYGSGSNYAETYDETRNIAILELFCEEVDSYFTSCMSLLLVNSVFMRILFNLYRLNVPSGLQAVQESHHCQVSQPTVIQSY